MTLYRVINPSDRVLLQSDDDTLVAITVMYLSNGSYGLERCSDGESVENATRIRAFLAKRAP